MHGPKEAVPQGGGLHDSKGHLVLGHAHQAGHEDFGLVTWHGIDLDIHLAYLSVSLVAEAPSRMKVRPLATHAGLLWNCSKNMFNLLSKAASAAWWPGFRAPTMHTGARSDSSVEKRSLMAKSVICLGPSIFMSKMLQVAFCFLLFVVAAALLSASCLAFSFFCTASSCRLRFASRLAVSFTDYGDTQALAHKAPSIDAPLEVLHNLGQLSSRYTGLQALDACP